MHVWTLSWLYAATKTRSNKWCVCLSEQWMGWWCVCVCVWWGKSDRRHPGKGHAFHFTAFSLTDIIHFGRYVRTIGKDGFRFLSGNKIKIYISALQMGTALHKKTPTKCIILQYINTYLSKLEAGLGPCSSLSIGWPFQTGYGTHPAFYAVWTCVKQYI